VVALRGWPAYTCGPIIFPDGDPSGAVTDPTLEIPELLASAGPPGVDQDNFYEIYDWVVVADTGDWISLLGYPRFESQANLYGGSYGYVEFAFYEEKWRQIGSSWCDPKARFAQLPAGANSLSLRWPDEYRQAVIRWVGGERSDEVSETISEFLGSAEARDLMRPSTPAEWQVDPELRPDPTSRLLPVQIQEQACASGQPPVDRDIDVLVSESGEGLILTVFVEPVAGGARCPGNPWYPITIELEASLGDRQLLDGAVLPPAARN
jgi:hypothetical protein